MTTQMILHVFLSGTVIEVSGLLVNYAWFQRGKPGVATSVLRLAFVLPGVVTASLRALSVIPEAATFWFNLTFLGLCSCSGFHF